MFLRNVGTALRGYTCHNLNDHNLNSHHPENLSVYIQRLISQYTTVTSGSRLKTPFECFGLYLRTSCAP
jgi:hypothetical protein